MKRLLILSLSFNVIFISVLIYWLPKKLKSVKDSKLVHAVMHEVKSLPADSNDIVFIGNSLTELFPLNELFNLPIRNKGIGGNKTQDVLNRIAPLKRYPPKKIFLMVGLNDINEGVPIDSIMSRINKIATGIRPGILYIQSVLPTVDMDKNKTIILLNSLLRKYCLENSISYIDLYPFFLADDLIKPTYTSDGFHLSLEGYKQWASLLLPFMN